MRQSRKTAHSHAGHDHHHEHHDCLACAALENKKKGAGTWLALAVGVVPCTGALLVLLFGVANDLLFPAILMVAAISTGMAIAMSGIGVLAILGRRMAFRRMKDDEAKRTRFTSGLRIAGAALVLLIGTFLFGLTYSHSGQLACRSSLRNSARPQLRVSSISTNSFKMIRSLLMHRLLRLQAGVALIAAASPLLHAQDAAASSPDRTL